MDVRGPRRNHDAHDAHEAQYNAKQSRLAALQDIYNDRARLVVDGTHKHADFDRLMCLTLYSQSYPPRLSVVP